MAIPLVPLVAGAVIGSLVTYLYKDEEVRSGISRKTGDVADKVKETAGNVQEKVTESVKDIKGKLSRKSDEEQQPASLEAGIEMAIDAEIDDENQVVFEAETEDDKSKT